MIRVWIEYLNTDKFAVPHLSKELFLKIIESKNEDLILYLLNKTFALSIPHRIQMIDSLPIYDDTGYIVVQSSKYLFTKNLRDYFKSWHGTGIPKSDCEIYTSINKLNISILNQETALLMEMFKKLPNLRDSFLVRALIEKAYFQGMGNFYQFFYFYVGIAVIFTLSTIWEFNQLYLIIPLFFMIYIMFGYEMLGLIF